MLPDAVRRLVNGFSIKPGERAVVLTVDDRGLRAAADLEAAGVQIAEVDRLPHRADAAGRSRRRARAARSYQVAINGWHVKADLVVMSGSPQPNYKLLAQAGARVEFDAGRGVFVPRDLPAHVRRSAPSPARSASLPCRAPCSTTAATSASSASARTRR